MSFCCLFIAFIKCLFKSATEYEEPKKWKSYQNFEKRNRLHPSSRERRHFETLPTGWVLKLPYSGYTFQISVKLCKGWFKNDFITGLAFLTLFYFVTIFHFFDTTPTHLNFEIKWLLVFTYFTCFTQISINKPSLAQLKQNNTHRTITDGM